MEERGWVESWAGLHTDTAQAVLNRVNVGDAASTCHTTPTVCRLPQPQRPPLSPLTWVRQKAMECHCAGSSVAAKRWHSFSISESPCLSFLM